MIFGIEYYYLTLHLFPLLTILNKEMKRAFDNKQICLFSVDTDGQILYLKNLIDVCIMRYWKGNVDEKE